MQVLVKAENFISSVLHYIIKVESMWTSNSSKIECCWVLIFIVKRLFTIKANNFTEMLKTELIHKIKWHLFWIRKNILCHKLCKYPSSLVVFSNVLCNNTTNINFGVWWQEDGSYCTVVYNNNNSNKIKTSAGLTSENITFIQKTGYEHQ